MTETPGATTPLWQRPGVIFLLLFAATALLFLPATRYDYINYDDNLYVFENAHIAHGFTVDGFNYAFHSIDGASWMPLTWISYMLDTTLYGVRPFGNHLTNILLHAASAGLLFLVLFRMLKRIWPAVAVAALFAFHPQRTESVVWIAERKDVLSALFWMFGLLAYERYVRKPGWPRMVVVTLCLLLGVMSKPMVISFPLILLLLDFWPLKRAGNSMMELRERAWPLIREKLPLFAICVAVAIVTVWSQGQKAGITPVHLAWYVTGFRVIENIGFYCSNFVWPSGLTLLYRAEPLNDGHVFLVGFVLAAITVGVVWQAIWPVRPQAARWAQPMMVGWFWFLFALAPVAGFIPLGDITVADRYSYLPDIGLALAVVYSVAQIPMTLPWVRRSFQLVQLVGIGACVILTMGDLPRWQNTYTIFRSAYHHGGHVIACDQYAAVLYANGDYQSALIVCNDGLKVSPEFAPLYNTRGGAYFVLGDLDHALADFNRAIELNPKFSATYYGRAMVYVQRKQYEAARVDVQAYHAAGGQLDTAALGIPGEQK